MVGVGIVILSIGIEERSSTIQAGKGLCGNRLHAHIEFRQRRKVGEVQPWIDGRPTRVSQWRRIIITIGVAVDGQPISKSRNTIREVKPGFAVTWIIAIAKSRRGICQSKQISSQAVSGKRMSHPGPNGRACKSNLKIFCGMQADLLQIEKRASRKLVAGQSGEEELAPDLP